MADRGLLDDALIARLPLPVAQLYRRAHNAKSPLERHLSAFYFWEAGLKLLASAAIVDYANDSSFRALDSSIRGELQDLARPALGHWWKFARRLVPILADANVAGWPAVRELLLGRSRDDLPRAAGLDAVLLDKQTGRATVRLTELFDRLVQYRNTVLGHAAPGHRTDDFHERQARALLAGIAEVWSALDVLAGRQLVYVPEVRPARGAWLVQRYELCGEAPRRLETLELPRDAAVPDQQAVYLAPGESPGAMTALHPLVLFDLDTTQFSFLNARRSQARVEYLCYTTGQVSERDDLGAERRELLARILKMPVTPGDEAAWSEHSYSEHQLAPGESPGGSSTPGESPGAKCRTFGEFELLSELGRGGMGVVYRAWQPSLGRQVALKKLLPSADLARAEDRFRREIKALGRVDHPHLVKVFTSGSVGDEWYFAMELVEGAPLSDVCTTLHSLSPDASTVDLPAWHKCVSSACAKVRAEEKAIPDSSFRADADPSPGPSPKRGGEIEPVPLPLPASGRGLGGGVGFVNQIVTLMHQVAGAAHALHEHGIVHRDIKPGNIQLSRDGAHATLMDLGLAQIADEVDGRLTRTRQFVGTLRYASPEQVLSVGKLDRRSDVYSLGATLWELLTLRPLFGSTDQTPTPQLMLDIQNREPEQLRKLNPSAGRDLEAVVHKCLEKRPEHRYATAADMAEDLRRVLEGEPVAARAVGEFDRAIKWIRRRPLLAGLYAALATIIVLAVGLVIAIQHRKIVDFRQLQAGAMVAALETADAVSVPLIVRQIAAVRAEAEPLLRERLTVHSGTRTEFRYALALAAGSPALLEELVRTPNLSDADRSAVIELLVDTGAAKPELLVDLALKAGPTDFDRIVNDLHRNRSAAIPLLRAKLAEAYQPNATVTDPMTYAYVEAGQNGQARRQAAAAIALLRLGDATLVWPHLRLTKTPYVRGFLIDAIAKYDLDPVFPALLMQRYGDEPDTSIQLALLLCLGGYAPELLPVAERDRLTHRLIAEYRDHPDAGLHGAIDWLLRTKWGRGAELDRIVADRTGQLPEGRSWFVNSQGQTFTIIPTPGEFEMGAAAGESNKKADNLHHRLIGRSFAISTREVTLAQYRKWQTDPRYRPNPDVVTSETCPATEVSWLHAAAYCNWLSELEGLSPDQCCYKIEGDTVSMWPDFLHRTGYRLLTEAEWEYAVRATTSTSRHFGTSDRLLRNYAWHYQTSNDQLWPVGQLMPNDFGLFDMLGNAFEWVQDEVPSTGGYLFFCRPFADVEGQLVITGESRGYRGGSYHSHPINVRSARREGDKFDNWGTNLGFRIGRTMPEVAKTP